MLTKCQPNVSGMTPNPGGELVNVAILLKIWQHGFHLVFWNNPCETFCLSAVHAFTEADF